MPDVDLLDRVRATGLLDHPGPTVVMLSGGRDSVCLLDLATRLRGSAAVRALHVNYGLRPDDADADEAACREVCRDLEVSLTVERAARPDAAGNLHAWARDVRYAVGAELCRADGAQLAAAHTVDDQLETVLYRLATSPGRGALLGMPTRSGMLVRPLLAAAVTRVETTAWCTDHDLPWRDDVSNADPAYARTRVREQLLPAFLAVDQRAAGALLQTTALLRDEAAALDAIVAAVLGDDPDRISQAELAALPVGLGRLVLRRMAEAVSGADCPRAATRLDDVLALSSGALDLGDGARATVRSGEVQIVETPPLPSVPVTEPAASLPPA